MPNILHPARHTQFTLDELDQIPLRYSGAYIIRWYNSNERKLQKIARMHGIDKHGILYVGGSGTGRQGIASRLHVNDETILDQPYHGGWTFQLCGLTEMLGRSAPLVNPDDLRFDIRHSRGRRLELEADLLHAYMLRHHELPPLNFSRPPELTKRLNTILGFKKSIKA